MKKDILSLILIVVLAGGFFVYRELKKQEPMNVESELNKEAEIAAEEDTPEIASKSLVYETEFTYEEVVDGEKAITQFIQTLFTLNPKELISPENIDSYLEKVVASDKIESYVNLYRTAVADYNEMSVFNIKIKDYNPKLIDIEGKPLHVMEYLVEFTTKDNIHDEVVRYQKIHVVKEDAKLKIFSNQKLEN